MLWQFYQALERLRRIDPIATQTLVHTRAECRAEVAEAGGYVVLRTPPVIVGGEPKWWIGILGVINAVLSRTVGEHRILAVLSADDSVHHFEIVRGKQLEPVPVPDPIEPPIDEPTCSHCGGEREWLFDTEGWRVRMTRCRKCGMPYTPAPPPADDDVITVGAGTWRFDMSRLSDTEVLELAAKVNGYSLRRVPELARMHVEAPPTIRVEGAEGNANRGDATRGNHDDANDHHAGE